MDDRYELVKKLLEIETREPIKIIKRAQDIAPAMIKKIGRKETEHMAVALLDGSHAVIKIEIISIGTVNRTITHAREIFRSAVKHNAVSIIMAHNHPSGNLTPSMEDCSVTDRIKKAGEILGIELLDHLIVSKKDFYSFEAERGIL